MMRTTAAFGEGRVVWGLVVAAVAWGGAGGAFGQSTAFTYQGELREDGQVESGAYDMQFRLYGAASGGSPIGSTVCVDNVAVAEGRFTVQIDFGQQYASVSPRFLEVAVRPDTGLDCSSGAGFTLLSRQALTPTPVASHAHGAYGLDRPDGTRAVSVNAAGLVGIGTASPARELTVAGNMEMGTSHGDYRNFRIGGGNSSGFLYGSFPALADGIHLGYNYYADNAGVHRIIQPSGGTSRITAGYGFVTLATANTGLVPTDRLTIDWNGTAHFSGAILHAPVYRYKSIHGAAFLPDVVGRDSGGFGYPQISGVTGYGIGAGPFVAAVELPDGAVVTEFRVFAIDERAANITATLGRTELSSGNTAPMATVTSSGAHSGVQNLGTGSITWNTVLNNNYAYWISAEMHSFGAERHKIIGARIQYYVTQPQP